MNSLIKELILLLLIGHVLGDFYFQSDKMALNKKHHLNWLIKHILFNFMILIIMTLPFFNYNVFLLVIFNVIAHFIIDLFKIKIQKQNKLSEIQLFCLDQILHILIIILSSYCVGHFGTIAYSEDLKLLSSLNGRVLLSWIFVILFIIKPASIIIKIALKPFEPKEKLSYDGIPKAGSLIGIFERIFILMMLYVGQYSAIGFVLTAKSIARYKKITEDSQFAEYYLLGTLLSAILVIATFYIFINEAFLGFIR